MYVTRPLSMYRKDPSSLSEPPTEGPNSGYIVLTDEETEAEDTCCWGTCKDTGVKELPFPQNKILNVNYRTGSSEHRRTEVHKLWFIPVLDQPLSSNQYYVIRAEGKYKGQACTCSKEEDMSTCCFCRCVKDVNPRAFDHRDIYQQVQIFKRRYGYLAKSIATDGFPPFFLRRKGWTVFTSSSFQNQLSEAHGLNFSLRKSLPKFDFTNSNKRSTSVVVGKWYCPFVFVKEIGLVKDQMKSSLYYVMTLEQCWEEIFSCENNNKSNTVSVNVNVQKEVNSLFGVEAMKDDTHARDGTIWYNNAGRGGGQLSLGLSIAIVEKMRRVQEMGGWRDVNVERIEEFKGEKGWKRFGCYVLVERFALSRLDGTLLLTCDFRHNHQIQSKWE
ncbi:hypothetical protein IFM89_013868 [Coptis chinensis]|uniref:Uncharacterized protein n=1 Tax=Coptis chinensis TaxID=261450 RepID=A0A835MCP4_9MAGN|nr:hypothetical protein IFM89_013868 [Coptis chinensis]